jgi:hypothetical protein
LPNNWGNPPNNQIPVLTRANWNDWLNVQYILHAIKRTDIEVAIIPQRNANQAGNGILRSLLKVCRRTPAFPTSLRCLFSLGQNAPCSYEQSQHSDIADDRGGVLHDRRKT